MQKKCTEPITKKTVVFLAVYETGVAMSGGKRLFILSKDEIAYYYNIPELSNEDRMVLFDLSEDDLKELQKLPEDSVKIDYILQLGYFRAKQYFFNFSFMAVQNDVWFIINNFFPKTPFPKKQVSKHHHYENQKRLLKRFKYKPFKAKEQEKLQFHAKKLAHRHVYSRFIFDELLNFCQQINIIKPKYSTMQSIISSALQRERDRILNKMYTILDQKTRATLDTLLKSDDSFYQITLLKKDPKDFCTGEMRAEVEKQQVLSGIYESTKSIMPKLNISAKNITKIRN